jgi:hypothetical protein
MKKYDLDWMMQQYRELAEKISPVVRAALVGELKVPEQKQWSEAVIGLALFQEKNTASLDAVIGQADILNAAVPTAEEVAWAFLRLRKRDWLVVQGDSYGLTFEGRNSIRIIVSRTPLRQLDDWISDNPPTRPMPAKDVILSLNKKKSAAENRGEQDVHV